MILRPQPERLECAASGCDEGLCCLIKVVSEPEPETGTSLMPKWLAVKGLGGVKAGLSKAENTAQAGLNTAQTGLSKADAYLKKGLSDPKHLNVPLVSGIAAGGAAITAAIIAGAVVGAEHHTVTTTATFPHPPVPAAVSQSAAELGAYAAAHNPQPPAPKKGPVQIIDPPTILVPSPVPTPVSAPTILVPTPVPTPVPVPATQRLYSQGSQRAAASSTNSGLFALVIGGIVCVAVIGLALTVKKHSARRQVSYAGLLPADKAEDDAHMLCEERGVLDDGIE